MLHAYCRENAGDKNGHPFVPGDLEEKGWTLSKKRTSAGFQNAAKGKWSSRQKRKKR
jgi:hypothetical protein